MSPTPSLTRLHTERGFILPLVVIFLVLTSGLLAHCLEIEAHSALIHSELTRDARLEQAARERLPTLSDELGKAPTAEFRSTSRAFIAGATFWQVDYVVKDPASTAVLACEALLVCANETHACQLIHWQRSPETL